MGDLDPAIQGSLITGIAMLVTLVITLFFNWLSNKTQRKASMEERFFYEVYPKRFTIYEDVIKTLTVMSQEEYFFLIPSLTNKDIVKKIKDDIHVLDSLRVRLELYGSPTARNIISILRVEIADIPGKILASGYFGQISVTFFNIIKEALNTFLELVRKEADSNMIDDKINKFLEKIKRETKKKEGKGTPKINGQADQ